MKVILFDIDGTLMLTDRAGQDAMDRVINEGGATSHNGVSYAGRTDRSIMSDLFRYHGIADTAENYAHYVERFLRQLSEVLPTRRGHVLPGVVELLECFRERSAVQLGLLTGNLRRAARIKLDHFQLTHYFCEEDEVIGGFGDHHHDRDDVAREALCDVQRRLARAIDPADVWVVGDTPLDVKCARAIGAHVVAVATGGFSAAELEASGPDLVVGDLTCVAAWMESF